MSDESYTVHDVLNKMENLDDEVKRYMLKRIRLFEDDANEEGASIIGDIQTPNETNYIRYGAGLDEISRIIHESIA